MHYLYHRTLLWCVRYADLLLGCVGGPLIHQCIYLSYLIVICVRSADLLFGFGGPLIQCMPFIIVYVMCEVYRLAPGLRRWASYTMYAISLLYKLWCVWCEVWRLSPGLHRWVSIASFLIIVFCCNVCEVCRPPLGAVSVCLSHIIFVLYILGCVWVACVCVCEVCRPALWLCRWVSHTSSYCFDVFCV